MSRYSIKRVVNHDKSLISCVLCHKEFAGGKAFKSHDVQVHEVLKVPTGIKRGRPIGQSAWNIGLTKEIDDRVRRGGQKISKSIKERQLNGTYQQESREMSYEARQRLSIRQSLNNSGGRCKWYTVDGKRVQGTWERDIAIKLCQHHTEWYKPLKKQDVWRYVDDLGIERSYSPDMYLPEHDLFLEIKGYWWGNDRRKMDIVMSTYPDRKMLIVEKELFETIMQGEQVWLLC